MHFGLYGRGLAPFELARATHKFSPEVDNMDPSIRGILRMAFGRFSIEFEADAQPI